MKLEKKIALAVSGTLLAGSLAFVPWRIGTWAVEDRMQEKQDAIVKNMCYNPLTRISDEKEFMRIYRAEEKAYDTTGSVMVTMEDLEKFEERKKYWPYRQE